MTVSKRNTVIRKLSSENRKNVPPCSSSNAVEVTLKIPNWMIAAIGIGVVISMSATFGLRLEVSIDGSANTQTQLEHSSSVTSQP